MTSKSSTGSEPSQSPLQQWIRSDPFLAWTWHPQRGKAVLLIGIGVTLLGLATSVTNAFTQLRESPFALLFLHILHVVLVLIALFWTERHYNRLLHSRSQPSGRVVGASAAADRINDSVNATVKRFLNWWQALQLIWFTMYLLYFAQALIPMPGKESGPHFFIPGIVMAILSQAEVVVYFALYWILTKPRNELAESASPVLLVYTAGLSIVVLSLIVGNGFGDKGSIAALILNQSALAVVMAMFIGRLDSSRLPLRPLVLSVCYLYAAIQPVAPFAPDLIDHARAFGGNARIVSVSPAPVGEPATAGPTTVTVLPVNPASRAAPGGAAEAGRTGGMTAAMVEVRPRNVQSTGELMVYVTMLALKCVLFLMVSFLLHEDYLHGYLIQVATQVRINNDGGPGTTTTDDLTRSLLAGELTPGAKEQTAGEPTSEPRAT